MTTLPSHIEAYLVESGFNATEMLVLKKLLEGGSLTLRELAAKTGKSTGVLDQAMKKLVRKHIVGREIVNDSPKYVLHSLDAVASWVKEDMAQKRELLKRKQQDFESFLATLKSDKTRPEMHYFDGEEGLMQAYMKLLQHAKGEMLCMKPILYKEEEDPLRAFFVDYFRTRRHAGVFLKVLTANTVLGRRYHSRDAFEYRETVLLPEDQFNFSFEKIIVGNTVACFNHTEKKASFIHYPDLAHTETALFHSVWNQQKMKDATKISEIQQIEKPMSSDIRMSTRTLSGIREFLLSRKSIATFAVLGVIAAALTYGLYRHNVYLNTQRVREKAMSIAATGALQFDANDVEQIHTAEDAQKPEYESLVTTLQSIRRENPSVAYAYIMRPTEDPYVFTFVADADSLDPAAIEDLNEDGIINDSDALISPGDHYSATKLGSLENAILAPNADRHANTDQWGTFISGAAPIKNDNGNGVAIFGIDLEASEIHELTHESFNPIVFFVAFFLIFVAIRLAAFNRSLLQEIVELFVTKKMVIWICLYIFLAAAVTCALYLHNKSVNLQRAREIIQSVATTAALQVDANDLSVLQVQDDWLRPEWGKVVRSLEKIRNDNQNLLYVYILRKAENGHIEFVSDSHSFNPFANVDDDPTNDVDVANDRIDSGVPDTRESDVLTLPGQLYEDAPKADIYRAYDAPTASEDFYVDPWGHQISGYAPIRDASGSTVAVMAVDMSAPQFLALSGKTFTPLWVFFGLLFLFILLRPSKLKETLLEDLLKELKKKNVWIALLVFVFALLCISFAVYSYSLGQIKKSEQRRLLSIVSTAALQMNVDNLNKLHTIQDMASPEYKTVFEKLNDIRNSNGKIQYIYILRPSNRQGEWTWVADADSSTEMGEWTDDNNDGTMQESEENVYPGLIYIPSNAPGMSQSVIKPTVEPDFISDQWGTFLSAYAPIKDKNGKTAAILGADIEMSEILSETKRRFLVTVLSLLFSSFCAVIIFMTIMSGTRHLAYTRDVK